MPRNIKHRVPLLGNAQNALFPRICEIRMTGTASWYNVLGIGIFKAFTNYFFTNFRYSPKSINITISNPAEFAAINHMLRPRAAITHTLLMNFFRDDDDQSLKKVIPSEFLNIAWLA